MHKRMLLAGLLLLGVAVPVWADGIPEVVGTTTRANWTRVVFNDSGSTLTSGSVVVWDNDDTSTTPEFDRSGYPYVTTTTTADYAWVAGVTTNPSCLDQSLCDIVVYGPARTRMLGTTVNAEDTRVGTSTTAGQADDYVDATDACWLGILMENIDMDTASTCNQSNCPANVFVNPGCE